jgi:cell wall-associated NlpC family hydrolase
VFAVRGRPLLVIFSLLALALIGAPAAGASTGGASYESKPRTTKKKSKSRSVRAAALVAGPTATIGPDGLASAPVGAPPEVQAAIASANRIIGKPYRYGGGHAKVEDRGYDCSGTVSYALIGAEMLDSPLDSSSFMRWGEAGRGQWITVYTNPGHAFVVIAGLRLDTSAANDPSGAKGPRWRPALRSTRGFRARHPEGF